MSLTTDSEKPRRVPPRLSRSNWLRYSMTSPAGQRTSTCSVIAGMPSMPSTLSAI